MDSVPRDVTLPSLDILVRHRQPDYPGFQQQRKITEAPKKLEMKKLYLVLVVIDGFADSCASPAEPL